MITTNLNKKDKYPYLGISDLGRIVLFTGKDVGFSFKENVHDVWREENFTLYNEPLTIQNEV